MKLKNKKPAFLIGLFVAILLSAMFLAGFLMPWREKLIDLLFSKQMPPDNIVLLAIDDESISKIGQWPWPRKVFGEIIQKLGSAAVIGIDVNFKEPSSLGIEDDLIFSESLKKASKSVVLSAPINQEGDIGYPIKLLADVTRQGFTNIDTSYDGIARRFRLNINNLDSFAFQVHKLYEEKINNTVPRFSQEMIRIKYYGSSGTFQSFSFYDIYKDKLPVELSEDIFKDRIVLIGATAPDLHDYHQTPIGTLSGVELQANAISTLIEGAIFRTNKPLDLFLIIFLAFLTVTLSFYIKKFFSLILSILVLLIIFNSAIFLLFDAFLIVDLLYPNVAIILTLAISVVYQYFSTRKEKKLIQDSFSRYLSPVVIDQILEDPSKLRLGGEKRELTILFSDIRNFTTISESMDPERLTHFLNRYLTAMTEIVLENNGLIDKYIGDAIMAFWGAPLSDKDHILNALLTAKRMIDKLEEFNRQSKEKNEPEIQIGIGINSGLATVGNLGSENRFDYTAIGDSVNLASRLEGLNKFYGTSIIVSGATFQVISQVQKTNHRLLFREIDTVKVKGKKEAIKIFELIPEAKQEKTISIISIFEAGLNFYYEGRWQEAVENFNRVLNNLSDDEPSILLKQRCEEFSNNQPQNWQGVFELTNK
ncbi:MAG: adenylate/guanylate cyclase domain-containing protein [Parcubacteria group bacterium]|nr:adenylate/guanylate cyclase domain-containing protein [Parcubacteria group bacterium]